MGMLDVFNSDAFTMHSLTASIDKLPYMPGRLGELNLFQNKPSTTSVAQIEERHNQLSILPVATRGGRGQSYLPNDTRKLRPFNIPHVPYHRTILAAELEGKRAFGSEDQTEVFASIVNEALQAMKNDHEVTHEWHRMGALKGIVLDADGTTEIVDFYDEFGIVQTQIDFNAYDAGTYDAADPATQLKTFCSQVERSIRDALGASRYSGIRSLCGDEYFDTLVQHPTARRAYEMQQSAFLRESQIAKGDSFKFGNITFENYRGSIGAVNFVETDEAVYFPEGAQDVFLEVPGPATFIEAVNTKGQMLYAKQKVLDWDEGVEIYTQSNVLYINTRPACVVFSVLTDTAPGT